MGLQRFSMLIPSIYSHLCSVASRPGGGLLNSLFLGFSLEGAYSWIGNSVASWKLLLIATVLYLLMIQVLNASTKAQ